VARYCSTARRHLAGLPAACAADFATFCGEAEPLSIGSLDLLLSYWQQPLHLDSRKLTAFTIQNSWSRPLSHLSFWNSTQTQQRVMEQQLMGIDSRHVLGYINDVIRKSLVFL
jgi:hypothetical protein